MAVIRVDPYHPDPKVIARAASLLRAGELVAFPTETVYGLGAHALDAEAVAKIYAAKGRPSFNPVIVHVGHAAQARDVAATWPAEAARLADRFWPGPLTLVLPKRAEVPDAVTAGLPSVGIRVPAHGVAHALLEAAGIPVAAPSANRYTELSPTRAAHVERALGDRVAMTLDGGPTAVGIESTVLDLSGARPVLLRPGMVSREALEAVVGPVRLPEAAPTGSASRPAPGMVERHYAPRARLVLFPASAGTLAAREAQATADAGRQVAMLTIEGEPAEALERALRGGGVRIERMPASPDAYAARLYELLHALDDAGVALVLAQEVPAGGDWAGVSDRLKRGAAGRLAPFRPGPVVA
ncbi:MAG: L-threonylcarbamoyladenylate synthase [Gemmatimonadaceae bacterium]